MKKKLVLVIAIVLVAVTACIALAGCAPSNPTDFMKKWTDSKNKAVITDGGYEVGINGNVMISIYANDDYESQSITEVDGDKIITYRGYKESKDAKMEWTASSMTKAEYKEMTGEDFKDLLTSFNKQYGGEEDLEITAEIFKNNFKKEKGWYVGSGLLFNGMGIKITAKEMLIKYDMKEEIEFDAKYVIGYKKITIPQEAKDALNKSAK